jgi:tetratricopeptide (TPR) repeat protein
MKWTFILLLCLTPAVAHADNEEAKAHYKKGLSEYALGHFKEAAAEYEAAFELAPDPALLYNAAQSHRLAGNKERALLLYENYLRLFPNRPNEREVRRHIANLRAAIASDTNATTSPPTDPMAVKPKNSEAKPPPETAPANPPAATTQPNSTQLTATAPPPKKKTPVWVWGVVGGVGGAVVLGVVIGLSVGLSGGTQYPNASMTVTLQ